MDGAKSILLSITGGTDLSLWEVNEAAKAVAEAAHPEANIIFGAMVDDTLEDQVWVTVVATRYGERVQAPPAAARGAGRRAARRAPRARRRDPAHRHRGLAARRARIRPARLTAGARAVPVAAPVRPGPRGVRAAPRR